MNNQYILQVFSSAIGWNAFSYIIYKVLFTALSFLLYNRLSVDDFAAWANINSMIYIVLLWIDFGFRKSIARFIPEFFANKQMLHRFVTCLIIFKVTTLLCATPLFFFLAPLLCKCLGLPENLTFFKLGVIILISDGITSIIKLIYHAHFWQKEFNLLSTAILILEMVANFILLFSCTNTNKIITGIFITKIIGSLSTSVISFLILRKRYKHLNGTKNLQIESKILISSFVKYSLFMWFSTGLKSLTERNVVVPMLTYTLGPAPANLFKIANDGALLFYRSVIKTIGTTDTSLFTHIEIQTNKAISLTTAIKKLSKVIMSLCLIAISIIMPLFFIFSRYITNTVIPIQLFMLITAGYSLEAILSPYERILEVKQKYSTLLTAYIPYISVIFMLFWSSKQGTISLFNMLASIHCARLLSSIIMAWQARRTVTGTIKKIQPNKKS